MPKDVRSGNPAKKAAAKKASVSPISDAPGRSVHRIKPKSEIAYFEFQLPDSDKIYRIPFMQHLTLVQVQALEDENSIAGVLDIFGEDEARQAVLKLDGDQLDDLMTAWRDASALNLGE